MTLRKQGRPWTLHAGWDCLARLRASLRWRTLLVLPVLHEVVDHGGIGQRRGVAEAGRFVLGDLAQDAGA
jgi:hypothetical protein